MNNKKALMLGAAVVTLSVPVAQKAHAATDALTINAKVIRAVAVTEKQTLNFGTVIADPLLAGTVAVDVLGGVSNLNATPIGANAQEGRLDLHATKSYPIDISLSATKATINWTSGGTGAPADNMIVDNFEISVAGGGAVAYAGAPIPVSLTAATSDEIVIGATLNVGAAQATGTYTGTINVNANYQ